MKKILPLMLVGFLILSGLGASAMVNNTIDYSGSYDSFDMVIAYT